ncbi:LysE family translocator [Celerinatantimonas sp. YJH-8]|uniref:LysE family translocator n=1 Tax=Celerinatantimonas sp. YJH-8 TaxID=3228714 RepID=UPI0038CB48BB
MQHLILAMTLFALVGAITPGPVNLIATSTALNHGKQAALRHVAGASIAYSIVVYTSGYLMQMITHYLPKLESVMKCGGSLFLLYLAYSLFKAHISPITSTRHSKSGILTGSFIQLLNPKAWVVAMSGVSLYVTGNSHPNTLLVIFTGISLVICFLGVGMWAMTGTLLAKYLETPTQQHYFNRVMAILLGISIIMIWI